MDNHSVGKHFVIDTKLTVLFEPFKVETGLGMGLTCLVFICLTILHEGLKKFRLVLHAKSRCTQKKTIASKAHVIQTFLYLAEFIFGYMIMLAVMSFNYFLFISVLVGSFLGLQLVEMYSAYHDAIAKTGCDQVEKPSCHDNNSAAVTNKDKDEAERSETCKMIESEIDAGNKLKK